VDFGAIERAAQDRLTLRTSELAAQDRPDVRTTELTPQIVVANPDPPTTSRDPTNVTGVGQMIVDEQNGFISLCTATLINPRTVVFAAHCVNERPANAYGQDSGGQPIGFGFSNNNNAAGNSAFGNWLANYQTNVTRFMYDANYVAYNPLSTQPNANSFLYGDVAIASLDTPAANVPTWALLFSALPATTITANGTGYHVVIDGYGNNGTGTTGSVGGIDFRRRVAENTLGALASVDEFENFLFGTASTAHPQNLYWIDFDDPRRGTPQASPFDFNAWRDNALAHEGITASGDSGGPLILDQTFARAVVIGVLSGGYTRFFNGQPANGYGTASFYQPLYLYWDWIAANNPYHYVSSLAGNGNWTDPTHWVTNLDPAYQVIGPNGQLVNGIPTSPGAGNTNQPGFGQACFQSGGISDCYDVASGTETVQTKPIGTGGVTDAPTLVSVDQLGVAGDDRGSVAAASLAGETTGTGQPADVLLPATLANGLPGATNFVPNNDDGNRLTSTAPRYFDVTLAAAGTTTLNSNVTIDRFTIAGVNAMLDIQAAGSLTSLIGVTQGTGTMQVNGALTTPGDYLMISGGLNGTGTITTPFFTSMAGTIAPGTAGTIGTLNFRGNVILASADALLIDLGTAGLSDRLAVSATSFAAGGAPNDGIANIGGIVVLGIGPGARVRAGVVYTILTAQGGVTGTFSGGSSLSAILTPKFSYRPNAVDVQIQAGLYATVVNPNSAVQVSYAALLDADR
ncbi:MAG: autotransporter domain-containing protein, partial [Alphaproteobacteria bacterium]|nr:autotransporter domain-containing protein [Alphaproteobacteria bacterium]